MTKNKQICFVISLVIIDFLIKVLVIKNLTNNSITIINNFLSLIYVKNYGVSFSMLSGNHLFILVVSFIAIAVLIYMLESYKYTLHYQIPILVMLSGAIGNLFDRIFRGYVVDYISFTFGTYEFAVFNFADMLVVCGCIYVIIYAFFFENKEKNVRS